MSTSVRVWSDSMPWHADADNDHDATTAINADNDSDYSVSSPDPNDVPDGPNKRHRASSETPVSPTGSSSSMSPPMSPTPSVATRTAGKKGKKGALSNGGGGRGGRGGGDDDDKSTRRRRRPPPPASMSAEEARELKLRRHNESELKRRQKLGGFFAELSDLCNGGNGPKAQMKILQSAIAHVRELQAEKKRLDLRAKANGFSSTSVTSTITSKGFNKRARTHSIDNDSEAVSPTSISSSSSVASAATSVASNLASPLIGATDSPSLSISISSSTVASPPRSLSLLKSLPLGSSITHTMTDIGARHESNSNSNSNVDGILDTKSLLAQLGSSSTTSSPSKALTTTNGNGEVQDYRDVELALLRSIARTAREVLSSPVDHHYLFRHACTPKAVISPSLHVLDCNGVMAGLWGMQRDEFLSQGLQCTAVTHPNSHAATRQAVQSLMAGSAIETIDKLFILPGHYLSGVLHMWLVRDAHGQPLAIECLLQPRVKYSQSDDPTGSGMPSMPPTAAAITPIAPRAPIEPMTPSSSSLSLSLPSSTVSIATAALIGIAADALPAPPSAPPSR